MLENTITDAARSGAFRIEAGIFAGTYEPDRSADARDCARCIAATSTDLCAALPACWDRDGIFVWVKQQEQAQFPGRLTSFRIEGGMFAGTYVPSASGGAVLAVPTCAGCAADRQVCKPHPLCDALPRCRDEHGPFIWVKQDEKAQK